MNEEIIITTPIVQSSFLEEIYSTFDSITRLYSLVFENENLIDISKSRNQLKKLTKNVRSYQGKYDLKQIISNSNLARHSYINCSLSSFHHSNENIPILIPPNPVKSIPKLFIPSTNVNYKQIYYPVISSVQFSIIDEIQYLNLLIEKILSFSNNENAIGVYVIEHPFPLTLCALCISTRDCEYLIDLNEIPNGLKLFSPIFSNSKVIKVFHNTSHCCNLLHYFGISDIFNVFCITTAAYELSISSKLEDLTLHFRQRLGEGWIHDNNLPNQELENLPEFCDIDELNKILTKSENESQQDWRLRPFSLIQMRLARQYIHYNLYLYDSLRLKLIKKDSNLNESESNYESLKSVLLISHHKSFLDWSKYLYRLNSPNKTILSNLYNQPLPNQKLYYSLLKKRQKNSINNLPQIYLSDSTLLLISLIIPKNLKDLEKLFEESIAKHRSMFVNNHNEINNELLQIILKKINKYKN